MPPPNNHSCLSIWKDNTIIKFSKHLCESASNFAQNPINSIPHRFFFSQIRKETKFDLLHDYTKKKGYKWVFIT